VVRPVQSSQDLRQGLAVASLTLVVVSGSNAPAISAQFFRREAVVVYDALAVASIIVCELSTLSYTDT
jgi:hypothetical protein